MDCNNYIQRRVKLGYVSDPATAIQLVDSIGNQVFDLLPVIQAGETDTSIELIAPTRRIRYYPEEYTRTGGDSGCFYDICIPDIAALMDLNELRNVESIAPATGQTIVYNASEGLYKMFDLQGALTTIDGRLTALEASDGAINARIDALNTAITQLTTRLNQFNERLANAEVALAAIENAIYNWANDKTTKIPRGTINITSGGANSNWIIQSRAKDQNEDLNFS